MHNPFVTTPDGPPELETLAHEMFGGLAAEELSEGACHSIRASMFAALTATGRAVALPRRLAVAGSALVAPLLLVGAASAATGGSPLEAPGTALEVASSALGIGRNSGDAGQPGSQPGNTTDAPGMNGSDEGDGGNADETPEPEDNGEQANGAGDEAAPEATPEEKLPPHENGKGCDDVLFANGEPPFASPGGPVGCEVGNSGDHRKNGAGGDEDEEGPVEPPNEPADDAEGEEDDTAGGTSRGLGSGHDEDRPGNGNGLGHDKHDHDPNPNGKGPGGPGGGADDDASDSGKVEPEPVSTAPGNSGKAKGKNK